jgi:hypothetical protein
VSGLGQLVTGPASDRHGRKPEGCHLSDGPCTYGSGGTAVLVDQATEDVEPFDSPGNGQRGHRRRRCGHRNLEVDPAVKPARVVVLDISGEHMQQVLPVPDQRPVQTLDAHRAHPPFG